MGVNLPGSIGDDPRIDAPRLEPFYARVAELNVPIFLHPTDAVFHDIMDGYEGALHLSLGRVVEVSVAAMRLVFSGLMDRYPGSRSSFRIRAGPCRISPDGWTRMAGGHACRSPPARICGGCSPIRSARTRWG